MRNLCIILFCCLIQMPIFCQEATFIAGRVLDVDTEKGIELVTIYNKELKISAESKLDGSFVIEVPENQVVELYFSRLGYLQETVQVRPVLKGKTRNIIVRLLAEDSDLDITIVDSRMEDLGMVRETTDVLKQMPLTSGNIGNVLPSIALGTNAGSGGELTSQYNVRGGNYDENLIYVNDFEIFRPQLLKSGQQEGLSFPNIDLIRDLSFSSGGFEAKYGDKLSSVLDIRYKRPEAQKFSLSMSLLGASTHAEGKTKLGNRHLRYLVGARYKTSQYLLNSLDIKGEYQPQHTDIQLFLTYDLKSNLHLEYLGNYNNSIYQFIPKSGETTTGTQFAVYSLRTFFEGQERDVFTNSMSGLGLTYMPKSFKNKLFLKLQSSIYSAKEKIQYDIIGQYRLGEIEASLNSDKNGELISLLGTGTQHSYARNQLYSTIYNVKHKGGYETTIDSKRNIFHQWSIGTQQELFNDKFKEWERLDSAGYALPYNGETVDMSYYLRVQNALRSNRLTASFQTTYSVVTANYESNLIVGLRHQYWNYNNKHFTSPRMQWLYKPLSWTQDVSFKLASGLYYQNPTYRELKQLDGRINPSIRSQKSAHFLVGMTYDFFYKRLSEKALRLIVEAYYKPLWDIIPYDIENVSIKYLGKNNARGYAIGLDARLNGEFVPGAESWINVSFLRARESFLDTVHYDYKNGVPVVQKDVARPSDQLFVLNMFFQDYLPRNDRFKVHMKLAYGSGIPIGLKDNNIVFRNISRLPAYKRVDVGFSYLVFDKKMRKEVPYHPFRWTKSTWVSLEVFNLMDIGNVASYNWIKNIYNDYFPVPNRLTSRRVNFKVRVDF